MHGKWTDEEDFAIVAFRLGTNLSWDGVRAKFDAAFPPANCKDLESRWNKTLRPTLTPGQHNRIACAFDDYRHYRPSHIEDGEQRRLVLGVLRVLADHPAERIVPPHPELESSGDIQQAAAAPALQPSGSADQLSAPPQQPPAPEQQQPTDPAQGTGASGQEQQGSGPTSTTAQDSPLFVPQGDTNVDAADSADNTTTTTADASATTTTNDEAGANSTVAVDTQTYPQSLLPQRAEQSPPDQPMLDNNAALPPPPPPSPTPQQQQQPAQQPSSDLGQVGVNPNIDPQLYGYQ
ncbi:Myb-like domain-containing protein [Trichophyton interdigitale]|nr:Myb-like domain-containing protein [Trichophyton interdigitale]KAG5217296.1 Myb-like domain-containing protein [Trichophyton interdigitale]KAG8209002.1 Myb-like domain-containing protein [Trichophyton interdigitale]